MSEKQSAAEVGASRQGQSAASAVPSAHVQTGGASIGAAPAPHRETCPSCEPPSPQATRCAAQAESARVAKAMSARGAEAVSAQERSAAEAVSAQERSAAEVGAATGQRSGVASAIRSAQRMGAAQLLRHFRHSPRLKRGGRRALKASRPSPMMCRLGLSTAASVGCMRSGVSEPRRLPKASRAASKRTVG